MSDQPAVGHDQRWTADQMRNEARQMIRLGYSVEIAAAILRIDVDVIRRLLGGECLGCE